MENYKEDTNQNSGTIFFIILFSLFVLVFSDNPESQTQHHQDILYRMNWHWENISII